MDPTIRLFWADFDYQVRSALSKIVYIANDIKQYLGLDDKAAQVLITATHIHEIAHSVKRLSKYDPPGEEGFELEKCVYGGKVGDDGRVVRP